MQVVQRPHWPIRIGAGIAMAAMALVVVVMIVRSVRPSAGVEGFTTLHRATVAALSTLVFLEATVFSLVTLENRLRRRKALHILQQLRSVAHVVQMHHLTKDPEHVVPQEDTASWPVLPRTPNDVGRYLNRGRYQGGEPSPDTSSLSRHSSNCVPT